MPEYDIEDPTTYPPVGAYMWHLHHEIIGERLTEPLQNRLDYIRTEKPEGERELRLRLIAPITAAEPEDVAKARDAYDKARDAYAKARDAYAKARAAYYKAGDAYVKAWDAWLTSIHATDCPAAVAGTCPWNGRSIF